MKSKSGWNENGNGTNESGFNGLPGGMCYWAGGFISLGNFGYWWSSTGDNINANTRTLCFGASDILKGRTGKETGLSVRCIKD